ncbi:30S ribosomal protein S1 [Deferrisoma camini]|uniref:30S ribosomal protein S1 n=1 Tax=Deferrisoma camini TaxID=1035120 RepID=UPI00046C9EFB|nr:30S ribosomal protein S1 [Deferrisoma camini]
MEQTSEMVQPEERMEDFGRLLEESLGGPEEGSVAKGRVVDITNDYAVIDIGYKSEGLVPLSEFRGEDGQISVQTGDEVEVLVERLEDADGMVVLSKDKADKIRIWDEISKAAERGDVVEGKIVARIKGGLSVDIGVRAFLPGSQVALRPVRQLEKLIGETYQFKIIKFNRRRGNIVLSRRVLLEEERAKLREKTLQVLEEGVVMKGVVKNITDYGAFVDLGGIDGLLHVTDMSWGRVNHPSEVVNIGDEVEVKILSFDRERERVSLGIKQLSPDPWESADERYPIGSRIQGRVVSLADYGAFVELEPGIEGLVHVSEMSWTKRINHPSEVVKVGEQVEVMVLNVDMNRRRISLGMKQCQPNPWDLLEERYPVGAVVRGRIRNITDFGIFVGVDEGIDGLIHVSDISWTKRVGHPATLYNVGDEVEAVVLHIDKDNERFSLGIKQLTPDPWAGITARYRVGSIVTGKVSNITDFGVFVELEPGVEGLVHVSEVSSEKVDDLRSMLEPGQEIQAEVLNIDQEERKISLSMKAIEDEKVRAEKMALDELNRQMAAHSATTLGEKILLAKQAKEAQENGEE